MKKILLKLFFICFILYPCLSYAEEGSDVSQELEELKTTMVVLEAENEDISDKLSRFVTIDGYADGEFIMTDKEGESNRFRIHHLSLFFKKQITERWRLFTEVEFEDAPKLEGDGTSMTETEGKIFIEVFTIEYSLNQYLNFRLGRYLTPGGIWNLEYTPFVTTQERPQHIRKIFPQLNDGLQLLGTATAAGVVTDYIVYVGNGSGNTGHGDKNEDKALGARLKFKFPLLATTELGASGYREKDNSDEKRTAYGLDLKLQWKAFTLQGEYATAFFEPVGGGDYDRTGYYGQFIYGLYSLDFIYRYDWYEADSTVNNEKIINTLALNYHFTPEVVGKIEHHFIDPENDPNYNKTIFSVAVYLGN